jgi:hypothetical protein
MKRLITLRGLRTIKAQQTKLPPLTVIISRPNSYNIRLYTSKMSFSNTDTGSKPADPYKDKNIDHASIKDKVEDLSDFVSACKFGMMTTRDGSSGALVSRCMALAAKVLLPSNSLFSSNIFAGKRRHRPDFPHQYRVRQDIRH